MSFFFFFLYLHLNTFKEKVQTLALLPTLNPNLSVYLQYDLRGLQVNWFVDLTEEPATRWVVLIVNIFKMMRYNPLFLF